MGALLRRASLMTALHHPQPQQRAQLPNRRQEEEEEEEADGSDGGLFGHLHASDSEADEIGSDVEGPHSPREGVGEEGVISPWAVRRRFLIIPRGRFHGQAEDAEKGKEERKKEENKELVVNEGKGWKMNKEKGQVAKSKEKKKEQKLKQTARTTDA